MNAPTLLDLALAIRDLDDQQNWSPAAQATAERARALAEQVLDAAGWVDEDVDRNWVEPTKTGGSHDGYDPHDVTADDWARMRTAGAEAAAAADEWVGWPNSVRRQVAA